MSLVTRGLGAHTMVTDGLGGYGQILQGLRMRIRSRFENLTRSSTVEGREV